jgi:hypothetical protein
MEINDPTLRMEDVRHQSGWFEILPYDVWTDQVRGRLTVHLFFTSSR